MAANPVSTTGPLFQAGGLASGLDTTSIVNSIISADSAPMLQVQKQQAAFAVQISTLGVLVDKLKALRTATDPLASSGLAPIQASSTYADFTVSGQAPSETDYTVQVETMARAAKLRSGNFTSAQDPGAVGATGTLQFSIDGVTSAAVNVAGKSLADIAAAINQQVTQVTASVVSTGSGYRLSVIRNATGYSTTSAGALQVVQGHDAGLGLDTIQYAQNASLKVDNLDITSQSNTVTNAIPGVTLTLQGESNAATDVNFVRDTSAATTRIQSFITAYNDVVTLLNAQLRPDPSTASTNNAVAGSYLLGLERDMQNLLTSKVNSSGAVQTLSDLNVSLQDDGTLALDKLTYQKTFAEAVAANPQAANQIFTKATTGIGALVDNLVSRQVDTVHGTHVDTDGALRDEMKLLQNSSTALDDTINYWQSRLDSERTRLTAQFTAMEQSVSTLNNMSTYLNALFYSSTSTGTKKSSG
jgi:flagellar hook-associated protein 2